MTGAEFADTHVKIDFIPEISIISKVFYKEFCDQAELSPELSDVGFNGTGVLRGCRRHPGNAD